LTGNGSAKAGCGRRGHPQRADLIGFFRSLDPGQASLWNWATA